MTKVYPSPVPGAKIKAFFREFPWIKKCLDCSPNMPVVGLKVERVDKDLGQRSRRSIVVDNVNTISEYGREALHVFDRDGGYLMQAGEYIHTPPREWWMWWDPKPISRILDSETLESSLQRLGENAKNAWYVLSINPVGMKEWRKYVGVDPNRLTLGKVVTVYKPPKDFNIIDWLEECVRREQVEIKTAVEKIDAA